MRRYFFLLLLLCASTMYMSAQTVALGLRGGYEAAMGYTDLWGESMNQIKSGFASGYQVGAWLRLGGKKIYLQPEVLLNVKKVSQTLDVGSTTLTATYKTQAIEIPLLVGYRFLSVGPLSLRLNAGPKAIINAGSSSSLKDYTNVVSQNFKTASWGLDGGIGIDILRVSLDLRYTQYLTNTSTIVFDNNQSLDMKSNKQSLYLTLGWRLF